MRAFSDPRMGYVLFACAAAAVLVASVVDPPTGTATAASIPRPLGIPPDKWLHAGTYAVLVVLLCHATRARTNGAVLVATVVVAGYGLGIELVQSALPARTYESVDVAANAFGAGAAALAWRVRIAFDSR